jgi:hypothetical protein
LRAAMMTDTLGQSVGRDNGRFRTGSPATLDHNSKSAG